jgi:fructosamine-3-kinase
LQKNNPFIAHIVLNALGKTTRIEDFKSLSGAGPNLTGYLKTNKGDYFLKSNTDEDSSIFDLEERGLNLLRINTSLYVPAVLASGTFQAENFLLMEWINTGTRQRDFFEKLGRGIAELHCATRAKFGLDDDNFISVLPQSNKDSTSWTDFYINQRLAPQLKLAFDKGMVGRDFLIHFDTLATVFADFFPREQPALLHGDLWSGNFMSNPSGSPVLIDPAVYYGHREMDLAFSHLFGGFDANFYRAYEEAFPLQAGFRERMPLYQLYPLLVHLNLFGKSYLSSINQILHRYAG